MQFARVIYKTPPSTVRRRLHQTRPQVPRVVAGARHLQRVDARRRQYAPETMGGEPHLAGPAHRRAAAARRRSDEPDRLRQGSQGPLHRRAVRIGLRRQQPDHPARGQRAAERSAPRPLAVSDGGSRPHLRREAHHRRRQEGGSRVRTYGAGRWSARSQGQAEASGSAAEIRARHGAPRAGQPGDARQRAACPRRASASARR